MYFQTRESIASNCRMIMNNDFEMISKQVTAPTFVLTAYAKLPKIRQDIRGPDRESNRAASESK
jgi:hypothetical protein